MLEGFRVKPAGVRALVFLLGGLAALLMVVGIALVSTLEVPTREIDIDAYNSAVEVAPVWNSGYGLWKSGTVANSFKTSTFSVATSQLQLATTGDSLLDEDLTGVVVTYDRARFERDYTAPTTTTAISIDTGITPYTLTLEAGVQVVGKFDPEEQSGVPLDYTMTYSEPGCVTVGECSDSLSSVTNTCKGKTYCMDDECVQNGGSYNYATRTCITTRYLQSVCVVVEEFGSTAGQYEVDESAGGESLDEAVAAEERRLGCYYETENAAFGERQYYAGTYGSTAPTNIKVQIRHKNDPYVLASTLTKGTYTFGQSVEQKRMPGYAVLGFGIALAVILCAILVWSNFRVATDDKQKGDQAQPSIIEVIKTSHLPSPPVSGSGQV